MCASIASLARARTVQGLAVSLAILLAACGSDATGPNPPPPPPPPPPGQVPAVVAVAAGDGQSTAPGTAVAVAPAVVVRDTEGRGVPGATVTFAVTVGGGSIDVNEVLTDAAGIASMPSWKLGPMPSENRLRATVATLDPVEFKATGRYLVATTPVSGTVTLPAGSSIELATLRVQTGIADVPVAPNGAFTASALPGGVQVAVAEAPSGAPLLFGWFDAAHRTLNARTTAEMMVYFDVGGYTLPEVARREALRQFLGTFDLNALVAAISAAIGGTGAAASLDTPAIRQARLEVLERFRAAAAMPRGIIIDPAGVEQSGVFVDQVGLNNITITNHRRRRIAAFVDRVSYVQKGVAGANPSPAAGAPIVLGAVESATSVIGTGVDILFGTMAWEPVVSEPQPVPLAPADAVATRYRVTVVGPGLRNPAVTLTAMQRDAQRRAALETLILEAVIPLLDQVLQADNALQSRGTGGDVTSAVSTIVELLPTEALEAAVAGDLQKALIETWGVLLDAGPAQDLLLNALMTMIASKGVPQDVILAKAKSWGKALGIVEAIATFGDLYFVVDHSASAQDAVTWDVNVAEAQVRLNPPTALIPNVDLALFHATVLDATDGGPAPVFRYRWSTTGTVGQICAQFAGCSTSIPASSRDVVSYFPDASKEGTDEVQVVVYYVENGQEHVIGEATAQVTTYAPKVEIAPQQSSIDYDEQVQLTATVDARLQDGGVLRYRWATAGSLGSFLFGETDTETDNNFITYTATQHVEGTETVTVTVTSTKNGVTRTLGSATATILVEHEQPTVIFGSWTTQGPVGLDPGRSCVTAYIAVPLIDGARSYQVRAYGFNDTAHWGQQITFGVTPPTEAYIPCGPGWGQSGTVGNEYRFFLTGFAGPDASIGSALSSFQSRFAGMVVEVTVQY